MLLPGRRAPSPLDVRTQTHARLTPMPCSCMPSKWNFTITGRIPPPTPPDRPARARLLLRRLPAVTRRGGTRVIGGHAMLQSAGPAKLLLVLMLGAFRWVDRRERAQKGSLGSASPSLKKRWQYSTGRAEGHQRPEGRMKGEVALSEACMHQACRCRCFSLDRR